eukprot:2315811-Pyramimonas_sp.AAC.1
MEGYAPPWAHPGVPLPAERAQTRGGEGADVAREGVAPGPVQPVKRAGDPRVELDCILMRNEIKIKARGSCLPKT